MKHIFHVQALPHTVTSKDYCTCAYTQKVLNFCKMMKSLGHTVYHYGAEGSEVECDEHITIITNKQQEKFFLERDRTRMHVIGYGADTPHWCFFNQQAIHAIQARKSQSDFLCAITGHSTKPVQDATDLMTVEYGIGYSGTFSKYRVFESYAWMHHVYGTQKVSIGNFYDAVIPNYFDPNDFPFFESKGDYYYFIGRLIKNKGLQIAIDTCRAINAPLIVSGQGALRYGNGWIETQDGTYQYDKLTFVGPSNVQERGTLMANAKATFVPTLYLEPFGGVNVESQLCGTPVITTDWGAFPETVEHGKTGYRCRTLDHFIWAARNVDRLDPTYIRQRAISKYSLDNVKYMYQEYFDMLKSLWGSGWYTRNDSRSELNWLNPTHANDLTIHAPIR